jgi:hypothetical protein
LAEPLASGFVPVHLFIQGNNASWKLNDVGKQVDKRNQQIDPGDC